MHTARWYNFVSSTFIFYRKKTAVIELDFGIRTRLYLKL